MELMFDDCSKGIYLQKKYFNVFVSGMKKPEGKLRICF